MAHKAPRIVCEDCEYGWFVSKNLSKAAAKASYDSHAKAAHPERLEVK